MSNEYYERTLRLKPVIMADKDLLGRMENVFRHSYAGESLDSSVLIAGRGSTHQVFSVGKVVDPSNSKDLFIALRINYRIGYQLGVLDFPFGEQLGAFEDFFLKSVYSLPYFVGAVTSGLKVDDIGPGDRIAGMLTEDLTCGGKYALTSPVCVEYCFRRSEIDHGERFFIDPSPDNLSRNSRIFYQLGEKYLSNEARIDLP